MIDIKQTFNKFGLASTYNPFTNSYPSSKDIDITVDIPTETPFVDAEYVVVSLGLIPEVEAFQGGKIKFTVIKDDSTEIQLTPRAGTNEIGEQLYPENNEVVWFDVVGLQGDFYLHSDYCGYKLHIKGSFMVSTIPANIWNSLFTNTNSNFNELTTLVNTLNNQQKEQRLKIIMEKRSYSRGWSVSTNGNHNFGTYTIEKPWDALFFIIKITGNTINWQSTKAGFFAVSVAGNVQFRLGLQNVGAYGAQSNSGNIQNVPNAITGPAIDNIYMDAYMSQYSNYWNFNFNASFYQACDVYWFRQVNY